ncbi:MAG: outer membrane beta-barrel protein [Saprospiraceae bacterium]|nr:outer membrane beta-barrel protein [Saprospiraceae bacterium]
MKLLISAKKAPRKPWLSIIGIFILSINCLLAQAQEPLYAVPSWWFGVASGANFNLHNGTNQQLNKAYATPVAFGKGDGIGLYLAPLLEYHNPYSRWGFMLQAGFDNRQGTFEEVVSSCNCPADLNTDLSYVSIEPSLRFSPILTKLNFYLYAGPRLAFNWNKAFTYQQGINPDTPEQTPDPAVKGDFDNIEKMRVSMQIGAGYDIPISSQLAKSQLVISPFVAYHPSFGQSPRSTESWDLSTLRVGAALKFGQGRKLAPLPEALSPEPNVRFYVSAPANIPAERVVREIFPLRNYVFFDLASTEIPERYVLLRKDQAKDFREDQLEMFPSKYSSTRSQRQMLVYYNVLNILGDRMGKSPSATIRLVGSSAAGFEDGMAMATSVQRYLMNTFGIDASRIVTVGRDKPKIPSEQPGATQELDLLRQGDRRVSIESNSLDLMTEFQHGPDAQLRPVEIIATQTAPPDSYVSFVNEGASAAFMSWTMEIKDDEGKVQSFGPYTQDRVSLPGKSILGTRPEGYYDITMKGISDQGYMVEKHATVRMVLWTPPKTQEGMRFSVLFEFNESRSITLYEKYLTDIVAPKIPQSGTVIIHGYTDIIGNEAHNQKLSLARADDVLGILRKSLATAGRTDVSFEVYGFGEDQILSPFDNQYPEERFYNRTVMIDIIPAK